jgi:pSer/pThr/pTyr-binding forkhead associated (FHA) protein
MPHGLLEILRYFLLILLWLFFIYAARMVLVDVRRPRRGAEGPRPGRAGGPEEPGPFHLRVVEPRERRGRSFDVDGDITLGRSTACVVVLSDDTYASSVHARVYRREGDIWLEDLGSTNGTFINEERLSSPVRLRKGDLVKVGSTVLEVRR